MIKYQFKEYAQGVEYDKMLFNDLRNVVIFLRLKCKASRKRTELYLFGDTTTESDGTFESMREDIE